MSKIDLWKKEWWKNSW